MNRMTRRIGIVATAVVAVGSAAWIVLTVFHAKNPTNVITIAGLCVPIVVALGGLAKWAVGAWPSADEPAVRELDALADRLADEMELTWDKEARERRLTIPIRLTWKKTSHALAGPVAAAVTLRHFEPLPGLPATGEEDLRQGPIELLHAVHGGLGSGRLVIAGPPGSGKTGTAVLLVRDALRHRRKLPDGERRLVPVPVLFNMHGWSPDSEGLVQWLSRQLVTSCGTLRGKAAKARMLLTRGKLAVILDGLDEIPEDLRPIALRALNLHANFRLILFARRDELGLAASKEHLDGAAAVELDAVSPDDAVKFLESVEVNPPPIGWRTLTRRVLQQDGLLGKALTSPLALTLVRDSYRPGDNIYELLNFSSSTDRCKSADDITDHLLDRLIEVSYDRIPGASPDYDFPSADRTLRYIAHQMSQAGTYDLEWWRISGWAHAVPRAIATGLVAGLIFGLTSGVEAGILAGAASGVAVSICLTILIGLIVILVTGGPSFHLPRRLGILGRRRSAVGAPSYARRTAGQIAMGGGGLAVGLAIGLSFGLADGFTVGSAFNASFGLIVGIVLSIAGAIAGTAVGMEIASQRDANRPSARALSPVNSWHADRSVGVAGGSALGALLGLAGGLGAGSLLGAPAGLAFGLLPPLAGAALGLVDSQTWTAALAFMQIARHENTPIRLLHFLEDARARQILRAVGPVYQFRHARLRDRLVGTITTSPTSTPGSKSRRKEPSRRSETA